MKTKLVVFTLFIHASSYAMESEDIKVMLGQEHPIEPSSSFIVTRQWAGTVVDCIEKRQPQKLRQLLQHPPVTRGSFPLNNNILAEIEKHRDEQLAAISGYTPKKIWNKFRAVLIDMGLPIATCAIGVADGIIAGEKAIIILSAIYFVLSMESALKDTYKHWTMKEYYDKIEEFDVWLEVLHSLHNLKQREQSQSHSSISNSNNDPLTD